MWRFTFASLAIYCLLFALLGRLVFVQLFQHKKFRQMGIDQYNGTFPARAPRGIIYDRSGIALALNRPRYDLTVHKGYVTDLREVSLRLAKLLGRDGPGLYRKLRTEKNAYVVVARDVSDEDAKVIELSKIPGVNISQASERIYPFQGNLAQVLGFTDIDGKGVSGLELYLGAHLTGMDGWKILQRDARGRSIMPIESLTQEAVRGSDVTLTIDHIMQAIAEEELAQAVSTYNAQGGTVIITDPNSGEILAMASNPGFNPNNYQNAPPETQRIRAITDMLEPGSTFKIVAMMVGLAGGMKTDDIVFAENGKYRLYGELINDSENHGWLSFNDVFMHSSNIATAKIAMRFGKFDFYRAARAFGFGNKTGIELPGETAGILKAPSEWSRFSLAAMSYGHEITASTLQMAVAYGAVANGGLLMKPSIVKHIQGPRERDGYRFTPQIIRRVMPSEIAYKMRRILKSVVEEGTGTEAKIEGMSIAGKTGTAQKPLTGQAGYSNKNFVASFVGFYPAEAPKLLVYGTVDQPHPVHSGGKVSAPMVRRIIERITQIYDRPEITEKPPQITKATNSEVTKAEHVPDLTGRSLETATRVLRQLKNKYHVQGSGTLVKKQETITERKHDDPVVVLHVGVPPVPKEYTEMPNVVGMPIRKAVSELSLHGISAKAVGSGAVATQSPGYEARVKFGAQAYLICEPKVPPRALVK